MIACGNTISEAPSQAVENETNLPTGMEDHREYFWDVIRFKVGVTRFQLPLYRFVEESEFFASQYGLCDSPSRDGFATSVIELDVSVKDFECFLKAFIPRSPAAYHSKPGLTNPEWISVLKLATKWRFNDLRKTAIDALHESPDLTTMERTTLAKEYQIPSWLLQGYKAFVTEMQSLDFKEGHGFMRWTKEEAILVGWDVVVELQSIVLGRYRSMLRSDPLKEIEDDILASFLLKEEYDEMKERSKVYFTKDTIKAIEEKRIKEEEEEEAERRRLVAELEEEQRQREEEEKAKDEAAEIEVKRLAEEALEEESRRVEAELKERREREDELAERQAKKEEEHQMLLAELDEERRRRHEAEANLRAKEELGEVKQPRPCKKCKARKSSSGPDFLKAAENEAKLAGAQEMARLANESLAQLRLCLAP
ncbi:hypothetical protein BKA70DRAFT_1286204 [Coprinopsis sp. MPI-PUGE-AT-0042]|nr:hypothetical protein BKA70DRAFT_1286204 [Coprinopsis sp. MPI-PUGE-AT-0042]